jgi:hypothetical protein
MTDSRNKRAQKMPQPKVKAAVDALLEALEEAGIK